MLNRNNPVVYPSNPVAAIFLTLSMGFLIFSVSTFLMDEWVAQSRWLRNIPFWGRTSRHSTMLILSLVCMLILTKGTMRGYGFRWDKNMHLLLLTGITLLFSFLVNALARQLSLAPTYYFGSAALSFLSRGAYLWIWTSISEEVFTRGLIQGSLAPFQQLGIRISSTFISMPVIVGALFFGAMHLILLTTGMDWFRVVFLVGATTLLGLFAGYHKERTGSLVAPVVIHLFFNMGGSLYQVLISL
jgi:membrane protease YdiL (CAAX protease family)